MNPSSLITIGSLVLTPPGNTSTKSARSTAVLSRSTEISVSEPSNSLKRLVVETVSFLKLRYSENSLGKCENTVDQASEFASPVSDLDSRYASSAPDGPIVTIAPLLDGSSRNPTKSRVSTGGREEVQVDIAVLYKGSSIIEACNFLFIMLQLYTTS